MATLVMRAITVSGSKPFHEFLTQRSPRTQRPFDWSACDAGRRATDETRRNKPSLTGCAACFCAFRPSRGRRRRPVEQVFLRDLRDLRVEKKNTGYRTW